ncbi:hypothetical protein [Massilia sp. X63]|uniref:hypothetical protein n=1 Tax=Massilia sp. X63 TaxID=3237285 RepID=UPI0034DD110C
MNNNTNTAGEALDLNKLKALAKAATPQNFDSAQITNQGCIECPSCDGSGEVELTADYCNYDGRAIGVQFYGIGPEHRAAEAFYRAANPAAILELIALVRAGSEASTAQQGDDDLITEAVTRNNVYGVLPNSASTVSIGRAVLAAHRAILAAPTAAQKEGASEQDAKDAARLLWFSREWDSEHATAYCRHVLMRGGDGDLSDIRTYLDAAMSAAQAQPKDTTDTTKGQA